ncbi:MAG: hypothetical protein KDE14_15740, partial [Rhodobacteraceae bacterium]|nr:hypothetical protein [Paracoccaceae bacterium]
GLGDEIMCARFAAALAARGASRVTWTCRPELRVLFDGVIGANEVASVREGESPDVGQHDVWAHMLSVARYLCPSPDSIPSALPYLRPDAARFAKWRGHLNAGGRKIGLVWKGGAQHPNDAHRSLPSLTALQPLWSVPDVTFYALQKGRDENLATPMSQPMVNLGPKLSDFADTAAVIAQLDLVISIDTAVAHLAGALGKPCWILVPAINPDWRWIAGRDDTPWYPDAVRLFRQAKPGDWVQPVQCMAAELAGFVRRP